MSQNTFYKLTRKTERLERLASVSETENKGDLEWRKMDPIIPSQMVIPGFTLLTQAGHLEIPNLTRRLNHPSSKWNPLRDGHRSAFYLLV